MAPALTGEAMTTNQTIDGVPRDDLELVLLHGHSTHESDQAWDRLRALLDAKPETVAGHHPACRAVDDYKPGECSHSCKPAVQPQGEPVALTAVGVLRDDGDGGLAPEWTLEGGTAELWAGAVLLIADEDQDLCAEDGHCELYREQPAPVAAVPERLVMTDGLHTYEYVTGHNAAIDKMLGVKS